MNDKLEKYLKREDMKMISEKNKKLICNGIESDKLFIELSGNNPDFTDGEIKKGLNGVFEKYSKLDRLKRCGVAFACITGNNLKRTKKPNYNRRVKPTARKSIKCEAIKDGGYLYNRCHLIGRQLATKKVNRKGLITGTRWFNMEGMSKFENEVAKYIECNPDHHILYRVTPYFKDNNLLAYGVQMEILDLDDEEKLSYNVFVYNKQSGFTIVYRNGDVYSDYSLSLLGEKSGYNIYMIDMDTNRFHKESCECVSDIKNTRYFVGEKQTIEEKYCKCEKCIH